MKKLKILSAPIKSLRMVLLAILSLCFFVSQSAFAVPHLSSDKKAMVHLMLSQTQNISMREEGRRAYNYADPLENPYGGFSSDIEPWIVMGARRSDSPNPKQRIKAYISDVGAGISKARKLWPSLTEDDILKYSKKDLPSAWENTLHNEKARNVLGLINGDVELTDKTLKKTMKAVRKEFQRNY